MKGAGATAHSSIKYKCDSTLFEMQLKLIHFKLLFFLVNIHYKECVFTDISGGQSSSMKIEMQGKSKNGPWKHNNDVN